jgi:hypothetical protein
MLVVAIAVTPAFAIKLDNTASLQSASDARKKSGNQSAQIEKAPSSVTGNLVVRVTDNSSGEPISNAVVILNYPTSLLSATAISDYTNSSGYVSFTSIPIFNSSYAAVQCVLFVGKSGYTNSSYDVMLYALKDTVITVSLAGPHPVPDFGIILPAIALVVLLVLVPVLVVLRRRGERTTRSVSKAREAADMPSKEDVRNSPLYSEISGADDHELSETTTSKETQTPDNLLRTCTICHMKFEQSDIVVRCPYCGYKAHKTHMLEWLHVKDYCPVCHRHVDERDLQ